jgi:hypothetical protein
MDEFVHYHALGCATAEHLRELAPIRDGCGAFDLRLPFTSTPLPLRSYAYIGSLPSLPFYPFWRWLSDPAAARVQGAVFFLLWLWLAANLLRVGTAAILTASLLFPVFLSTFVVDEGPVGLSVLLFVGALLAARRSLDTRGRRAAVAWAVLAGLVLFHGLWVKLVFAWWLPAFAAFALVEARRRSPSIGEALGRRAPEIGAGSAAVLLPTLLLLASVDRDGRPYADVSRWSGVSTQPRDVEAVALHLGHYLVDAACVVPRNLVIPDWPLVDALPAALAVGLLALGLWRGAGRRREMVLWSGLGALTFAFVASSGRSQWPHHFAFPLLLLVFALAIVLDAAGPRARLAVACVVVALWAGLGARLPAAVSPADSSPEKDQLLAFVRAEGLDRRTLQVHSSWGTYYIAQLFGDRRRLLAYLRAAPDDPEKLREFRDSARGLGRSLLLTSDRRWERIQTPGVARVLGAPVRAWRFGDWWAIEYDTRSRD